MNTGPTGLIAVFARLATTGACEEMACEETATTGWIVRGSAGLVLLTRAA